MANVCEEFVVKATTTTTATTACTTDNTIITPFWLFLHNEDTEEVKCPGHIDDGVSGLRLLA